MRCSSLLPILLLLGLTLTLIPEATGRPQFDLGSLLGTGVSSFFNTAFGRDCKGRARGDYFYGCQCVGPFNVGRKKRSPQNKFFINSNQGLGGEFVRCSV